MLLSIILCMYYIMYIMYIMLLSIIIVIVVIVIIDSIVNSYIRKWLDILISGTLSTVFLTRNKFGLNICPPSIKFTQCQTILCNALKTSPNEEIN